MLINQMKHYQKAVNNVVPEIYASIAIALHEEYGWGFQRINKVFCRSQHIWEDSIGDRENMLERCERLTGIDVRRKD